jgi:hypothetical protein
MKTRPITPGVVQGPARGGGIPGAGCPSGWDCRKAQDPVTNNIVVPG